MGVTGPLRHPNPSLQALRKGLSEQWNKREPNRIALKLPTHQIAWIESQGLPKNLWDGDLALGRDNIIIYSAKLAYLTGAVADPDHGVDVAARVEVRFKLHPDRIGGRHQIVKDAVRHLLMGNRLIAIAIHVQLDRLEFHNPGARLIDQAQQREIGVAGEGALASELWQLNRHLIRPA